MKEEKMKQDEWKKIMQKVCTKECKNQNKFVIFDENETKILQQNTINNYRQLNKLVRNL